jgi:hypothetical protein
MIGTRKGRNINNRGARSVFKVLLLVHGAGGERHKTRKETLELSAQSFNLEAEKISSFSPFPHCKLPSYPNILLSPHCVYILCCAAVYVCSEYATLASLRLLSLP